MKNKKHLQIIFKLLLIILAFYLVIFPDNIIPDGYSLVDGVIISRSIFIVFILNEMSKIFDNIDE